MPRGACAAVWEQHGPVGALQPRASPAPPHVQRRARPAPSRRCLSPSRRAGGSPAASTRRGKTNPTVRRPPADSTRARGWVSSSEGCCGQPVPSRRGSPQPSLRGSRAPSPQFAAVGVRRGPRAPSGRPQAAGGRGSGGSPGLTCGSAPPPGSSPARPGPGPLPRWRGRAMRARLRRRARLAERAARSWRGSLCETEAARDG